MYADARSMPRTAPNVPSSVVLPESRSLHFNQFLLTAFSKSSVWTSWSCLRPHKGTYPLSTLPTGRILGMAQNTNPQTPPPPESTETDGIPLSGEETESPPGPPSQVGEQPCQPDSPAHDTDHGGDNGTTWPEESVQLDHSPQGTYPPEQDQDLESRNTLGESAADMTSPMCTKTLQLHHDTSGLCKCGGGGSQKRRQPATDRKQYPLRSRKKKARDELVDGGE